MSAYFIFRNVAAIIFGVVVIIAVIRANNNHENRL